MPGKLVETIYGAEAKNEVREQPSRRATKFGIDHNGCPWRGEFVSLSQAV